MRDGRSHSARLGVTLLLLATPGALGSFPDPPRQGKPWTPPGTKLPRFLVAATETLFAQGVADPRGCEYREVSPAPEGYWRPAARPGAAPPRPHMFVLPAAAGDERRFAVDWGGHVVPVRDVGPPADLDADLRDRADSLRAGRAAAANDRFRRPGAGFWRAGASREGRPAEAVEPIQVCLLLRLGRADLAESLFAAATLWKADGPRPDLTDYGVSYLTLAQDWAGGLYLRGVDAHGRGDDAIALDAFRRVAAFRRLADAKAEAMGFPMPRNNAARPEPVPHYVGVPDQLDALLADQERRAKEPPRGPIPGRDADPAERVAALIRDLDQIAEHQTSVPGAAYPGGSPLVHDLIAMGDPAVVPLLEALVHDHRLTRSISFGRWVGEGYRHVAPTVQAIVAALDGLMKTTVPGIANDLRYKEDDASRKALAAAYRKFWEANRAVPLGERHYRTLADDAAAGRWLEAARALTSPAPDAAGRPRYPTPGKPAPPLLGEPYRKGREPSLTDLLVRRTDDLARQAGNPASLGEATSMAELLATWDPPAAVPVLKRLMDRIRQSRVKARPDQNGPDAGLAAALARFALLRARAGDRAALDEYADWIRTITPDTFDRGGFGNGPGLDIFEPLWAEREHPSIAAAARALFADPASPWHKRPDLDPKRRNAFFRASLEDLPLLRVSAFRDAVLAGLDNKTVIGTVEHQAGPSPSLTFQFKEGQGGITYGAAAMADIDELPVGEKRPVRACDWLAWKLAKLDGTPRFELYWPEPRRDKAIVAIAEFLRRFGDDFEATGSPNRYNFAEGLTRLAFPRLSRPATPEDVEAGRAIFSLAGEGGEVRIVPLPEIPLHASWMTLEDTPLLLQGTGPDGKPETRRDFDRRGRVWQAEEVKVGDVWQRYYGFVGASTVGRAPAAEVLFDPRPSFGTPPAARFGVDLALADPPEDSQAGFRGGAPVVVVVRVRNRTGLDQAAPTEFVRPAADGKPALRAGITLKLTRTEIDPTRPPIAGPPRPPEDLPPSRDARFTPGDASRTLGPAAGFEAFRVDLRDWFDVTRPGQYRLVLGFGDAAGMGPSDSGDLYFRVGD